MFVQGLLTCVVLSAFSAQAKVVTRFAECSEFFYKATEPRGMDQNSKKICQKLQFTDSHYATLYSVPHRIPLYSAYRLDPGCSRIAGRTSNWHVEPQISQPRSTTDYMVLEKDSDVNIIKGNQAISSDYSDTGYDRGHLYPNSFSCTEDGRTATFTLTNAAPMDACFNRVHWKDWESYLRSFLMGKFVIDGGSATAFIVTGTIPYAPVRIPGGSEDLKRVTVPSHIWTAVCYKHHRDDTKSLSFGYLGNNVPEGGISLMRILDLNQKLSELYREYSDMHTQSIKIFVDDCFGDNDLDEVEDRFQALMNRPVLVVMNKIVRKSYKALKRAISSDSVPEKKVMLTELMAKLAFDSLRVYQSVVEELKMFSKSSCLIIKARMPKINAIGGDLKKRDINGESYAVECLLVPEKQNIAADGTQCLDAGCKSKPRCSSPCLYQDTLNAFRCSSGQKQIECSPQYSLITVKGERCLDDHPCATYGYEYYWCKTGIGRVIDDWGYCSPPLWHSKAENGKDCRSNHACAKYGESQPWCYTDDGKKNKCCASDDCLSAVNSKTCKSDHKCGKHGKKYMWCYTTDGGWDYCCTSCS